ncbi:MAG: ATP-binding protein [Rhabdochlamydiaceae bacterium]|nr:ATP-binding protein [Candidatus Amphrikana amoebophyrae]
MKSQILKQIIADQREYTLPKHFFERELSKTILEFAEDPSIIITSGIRRSGKSTIQRALQETLNEESYFFNFDDERLIQFQVEDFQLLLEVLIEVAGNHSTFFFDEIQNIKGWERFVRRLYEQGKKIFITGSNANLLSKELGTHLTGRYIQLEAYPLSFREIVNHESPEILAKNALSTQNRGHLKGLFSNYIKYGGIPEYVKFKKPEYLKDLLDGILYRDIITKYGINDEKALREVVFYLASNIGKEFSYTKIAQMVGIKSPNTISKYCDHFEQCYLFFFINRYNHSLKKQIQSNKKSYMIDPALIRIAGFRVSEDRGRLLENIVFLHLKRKTKEIYFHKEKKECDFILREGNQITEAIQVTTSLSDPSVRKREFAGLLEAMESYNLKKGIILTEDEEENLNEKEYSIRIIPIHKWLLSL